MQATVKIEANIDVDDLQNFIDNMDYISCSIECDEVTAVHGDSMDDKIDYLVLVDKHGEAYELYCDHHNEYYSESDFEDAYVGTYASIEEYVYEYYGDKLEHMSDIIKNNIDWEGVRSDLDSELTILTGNREIFIYQ